MGVKTMLVGRALGVPLGPTREVVVESLRQLGLKGAYMELIAAAAIDCATEETSRLRDRLFPQVLWQGTVICRRLYGVQREPTWLVLRHVEDGWLLDAVLFG